MLKIGFSIFKIENISPLKFKNKILPFEKERKIRSSSLLKHEEIKLIDFCDSHENSNLLVKKKF